MLHPYMVWAFNSEDGAVLAFARTAREARNLGAHEVMGWTDCDWTDVRVRRIRQHVEYLTTLRRCDAPHAIENPPSCDRCFIWGYPPTEAGCEYCDTDPGPPLTPRPRPNTIPI